MNIHFNKKYRNIVLIACMVILFAVLVAFVFFNLSKIGHVFSELLRVLRPVTYGLVIAYLFTPLVNFFERRIFFPFAIRKDMQKPLTKKQRKRSRVLSMIVSMVVVYSLLSILLRLVIPQLGVSISRILTQLPGYMNNLQRYANDLLSRNADAYAGFEELFELFSDRFYTWLYETALPYVQDVLMNFSVGIFNALRSVWYFVIGVIISIYVLYNKEIFCGQAKKIVYATLSRERANLFIKDVRFVSDTFISFIGGKIIDSLIVGVICFICCQIFHFPYPLLISVIIGITNVIPVFGPFLGAIPSAFLILMVDPVQCLYFILFILVLQQIDGHIIGPSILGEATGISGFWVIFAITVFGGLWGVAGMFIGIPLFAVIYALIRRRIDRKLQKRNLPTETYEYMPLKRIDEDGSFLKLYEAEEDYIQRERERRAMEKAKKKALRSKERESLSQNLEELVHHIKGEELEEENAPSAVDSNTTNLK